jgi:glutamyl-tRNA synthetase
MEDLIPIFRKHVLKNRIEYGKADLKSCINWIVFERPDLKVNIKNIIPIVQNIVEEVNNMNIEEVKKEFSNYVYQEYVRPENRFKLLDAGEYIVLRFAPEPSGYLHIGHMKALFINLELLNRYKGELILRFDDTNPSKVREEYVNSILEDLDWLGVKFSKITFTSDYMNQIYEYAEQLIRKGKIYLTTSSEDQISNMRKLGVPIKDRSNSVEENLELFEKAISGEFNEGEIVALYKGNLDSFNTTMRDPTVFRVINSNHFRAKYYFWPTYDFATPIVDSLQLVTHALRSKEYELRAELYHSILRDLNLRDITLIHFSRLEIKGIPVSKREIRNLVEQGVVEGWDDLRLVTLKALRRRGILPQAIKEFVLSFGMGKQETKVSIDNLLSINRKYLKPEANVVLIKNPVKLSLDFVKDGNRIKGDIYIDKSELFEVIRLKNIGTFRLENNQLIPLNEDKKLVEVNWIADPYKIELLKIGELFIGEELNKNSLVEEEYYIDKKYADFKLLKVKDKEIYLKRDEKSNKYIIL